MTSTSSNDKTTEADSKQEKGYPIPLSKVLRLPIDEADYEELINNPALFRMKLDEYYQLNPELFPESMSKGYHYNPNKTK